MVKVILNTVIYETLKEYLWYTDDVDPFTYSIWNYKLINETFPHTFNLFYIVE